MIASTRQSAGRPPVSAAIICYNEEANIGRSLDALGWCDEIVVVDSGSTDATLEIVARYPTAKVFARPFDTYVAQKNFALDRCTCDWVLSLDADEVATPELIDEIADLAFDAAGYEISRRPFIGDREIKHGTWNPGYKLRLFRRSRGRWGGSNPHERVVTSGRIDRLNGRILHYSYRDREEFLERNRRYTRMMVDYLAARGCKTYRGQAAVHWFGNFFKSYLVRKGFLDGGAGLFLAYHIANFSYMKYAMLAQRGREKINEGESRAA